MEDEIVAAVTAAFRAELGRSACPPDDSFFQLGGDSLMASRMLNRLNQQYDVRIPFAELYRDSRPPAIAAIIVRLRAAGRPPRRSLAALARRRRMWFPLALSQEGLYEMDRVTSGAGLFNNVAVLRFTGDVSPDALRGAVADAVRRQSALRLVFGAGNDGTPQQRLTDDPPEIETRDLRGRDGVLGRWTRREWLTGFDLHAGPAARFALARLTGDAWAIVATFHHIVFDGVSQELLVDDLAQAYAARTGGGSPLAPLSRDYADFAEWQRDTLRGDRLEEHLDAIRASLGQPGARGLAPDRSVSRSFTGRARRFAVGPEQTKGLRALAAAGDTTLFVVLVAALLDFVARRTGDTRPALAIQAANRIAEGATEMVGCFANSVTVATDGPGPGGLADVIRTRVAVGQALAHQEMPLEPALRMLRERLPDSPDLEYRPQAGFAFQPGRAARRELGEAILDGRFLTWEGNAVDPTSLALVLELFSEDGALAGLTHHRAADWTEAAFTATEADLTATLARFSAVGAATPPASTPAAPVLAQRKA